MAENSATKGQLPPGKALHVVVAGLSFLTLPLPEGAAHQSPNLRGCEHGGNVGVALGRH